MYSLRNEVSEWFSNKSIPNIYPTQNKKVISLGISNTEAPHTPNLPAASSYVVSHWCNNTPTLTPVPTVATIYSNNGLEDPHRCGGFRLSRFFLLCNNIFQQWPINPGKKATDIQTDTDRHTVCCSSFSVKNALKLVHVVYRSAILRMWPHGQLSFFPGPYFTYPWFTCLY
jgi:hypothetical protein